MLIKKRKQAKHYKQLKQISEATLLEESSHLKLILNSLLFVGGLLIVLFVWASFVEISETTTSFGELVPKGHEQLIQHLEGGIISAVLVKNGDLVKKGQLLLKIDSVRARAELDELRSKEVSLILRYARIDSFLNNKPADLEDWSKRVTQSKYNPVTKKIDISSLLYNQKRLLESEYDKLNTSQDALKNTILEREEKLKQLKEQKQVWLRHDYLLRQEFDMYQKLKEKSYVSQKDYLTALRAVNQAKGDGERIDSETQQTQQLIQEARNKLKEDSSKAREAALEELSSINTDLLETRHRIDGINAQIQRSDVKSPIAGIVKGADIFVGNVVRPGGVLMQIVPQTGELMVESKVLPQEVGYVHVGDVVKVKVLTYDYARFGAINAKVMEISASTFREMENLGGKDNKPYYKAIIHLENQFVGKGSNKKELRPGMTVQADIITGKKTLLEYLLKPIHRSLTESFRER